MSSGHRTSQGGTSASADGAALAWRGWPDVLESLRAWSKQCILSFAQFKPLNTEADSPKLVKTSIAPRNA
eukprot:15444794-Alexandrium_andersonii.AAC.1